MRLDPDHELSPQAIVALRDLLQEPGPPKDDLVTDERLESFILGTASKASRRETVRSLVALRESRLRMIRLQRDLCAAAQQGFRCESPFKEILGHGVSHALGLNDSTEAWDADPQWGDFDERAPSSLRSSLKAIGGDLNIVLAMPHYATLRSGVETSQTDTTLYAEVDDEGTLVVDAVFAMSPPTESSKAFLDLLDPAGGFVRLGSALVERSTARFVLNEFTDRLGMEAGSLPGNLFRVVVPPDGSPLPSRGFLLMKDGDLESFAIVSRLTIWEEGTLDLTLTLPENTRERPESMELFVKAGSVEVVLYRCLLSEFEQGEKSIQIPTEGLGGARSICGSLLRARIVPANSFEIP